MSIRLFVYALFDGRGLDLWRVNACREDVVDELGDVQLLKSVAE